jgi:primosomal replication protein N''
MNSIERLSVLLKTLETKAIETDILNTQLKAHRLIENNNLFSNTLFVSQSDQFGPYISEINRRINEFSRLVSANKIDLSKVLLIQIEQQISSISNALHSNGVMHQAAKLSFEVSSKVRNKKAKQRNADKYNSLASNIVKTSHQLYQKLAEHHEFERRLMDMIHEREQSRLRCRGNENEKLSSEVLALHQRLGRCRRAISAIEQEIAQKEKR